MRLFASLIMRMGELVTKSDLEAFHELCAYTLEHARHDPSFIHQHVVDAYAAQRADAASKRIGVAFALVGLYLRVERRQTGRQVQLAHMRLARERREWPQFELPEQRGALGAADVLAVPPGPDRDRAIDAWCASVWGAFAHCRAEVMALVERLDATPARPPD